MNAGEDRVSPRRSPGPQVLLGLVALAVAMWLMRGFVVDDAWIPVRYARHIASGEGHSFNAGAITDGCTSLVYPWLLSLLAHGSAATAMENVTMLGRAITFVTMAAVLWHVATSTLDGEDARGTKGRARSLVLLFAGPLYCWPLVAYAGVGLETPWAAALAVGAVLTSKREKANASALLAGMAALFRPEMVVWAAVFTWFASRRIRACLLSVMPFVIVALVRLSVFGRAYPLSIAAKPSDLSHGATYALASLLLIGAPIAFLTLRSPLARAASLAFLAHTLVVIAVGGDWMPFARLFAPVLPTLYLFAHEDRVFRRARFALALAGPLWLAHLSIQTTPLRAERASWIEQATPVLRGARRVAALDIGWVSATTEADIVDLAGLTDPAIARLPGGHTSKRIDANYFLDRAPDAWVVWSESSKEGDDAFGPAAKRVVDERLRRDPRIQSAYARAFEFDASNGKMVVYARR